MTSWLDEKYDVLAKETEISELRRGSGADALPFLWWLKVFVSVDRKKLLISTFPGDPLGEQNTFCKREFTFL